MAPAQTDDSATRQHVRGAKDKVDPTRSQVDQLIGKGRLVPLGYYGWGTR